MRGCTAEVADYRELAEVDGYDALVSVGMAEHVGEASIDEYFARAWRLLRPGGVFLNHAIAPDPTHQEARGQSLEANHAAAVAATDETTYRVSRADWYAPARGTGE
ncbi:MAG TPA: class I SAM-dependent methyltransferase [Chloroflexota bacterium]